MNNVSVSNNGRCVDSSAVLQVNGSEWKWRVSMHVLASFFSTAAELTCRFGREFVPVGSAHSQQPVAQVQVKPLLSSDAAHHLGEEKKSGS